MDTPMGQPEGPEPQQIRVNFTTTSPDLQLLEGRTQLLVPADIKRYGLSRVLNSESMLATTSPIPFDFLVDGGEFLRTSIHDYLRARGLSSETTLNLQYVRSLIPPVYRASFQHDDWVADVDVLSPTSRAGVWSGDRLAPGQDRLLSASYDGLLRVWNGSNAVVATSPSAAAGGHSHAVRAARFLSSSQVASAGLDRVVRVWRYAEADDRLSGVLKPTLELHGHAAAVEALDIHGPAGRVLSAASDGAVALWSTSKSSAPPMPENVATAASNNSNKKRKITASSVSVPQRGPLSLMRPHASAASAVLFDPADATVAYTASQDHTVRTLDLTTGRVENTITTSHPLLSLCAVRRSSSVLLAAGTSARHVTLADPRAGAAATSVMTLRGHRNMVSCVAPAPDSDHALVSGSHDGTCRVWDLRSVRAATRAEAGAAAGGSVSESVYVIERESLKGNKKNQRADDVPGRGAKVFGLAWDKTWGIVSAGEDKQVQINSGRDLLVSD
ncbi:ribosome biogenesis protein YTM1 [Hypoxylon sp. FL1284]|nr:ribosome biogenesis protein YTM1 [Hypoxylon sp. FL1284]